MAEDEEGEQMDYLGGEAAPKPARTMAKFRQASCLPGTNRMALTVFFCLQGVQMLFYTRDQKFQ